MRSFRKPMAAAVVGLAGGAAQAEYPRRNPIVEAVDKTDPGVISLKVSKWSEWGRKSLMGTGVIVDERGYAITNAHVVERAEKVTGRLHDETTVDVNVQV